MAASSPFPLQGSCFCATVNALQVRLEAHLAHLPDSQPLIIPSNLPPHILPRGCPFIHTVHIPNSAFAWTHCSVEPQSNLDTYTIPSKTYKTRYRCKTCGTSIASYNAQKETWSVWGACFKRDTEGKLDSQVWEVIKPDAHIFYGTRMLDVNDDVGKWEGYKDVSKRLG